MLRNYEGIYEQVFEILDDVSDRDIAELYNPDAFIYNDYYDDETMTEWAMGYIEKEGAWGFNSILSRIHFGDCRPNDEFYWFNAYENIESGTEAEAIESICGESIEGMKIKIADAMAAYLTSDSGKDEEIPASFEELAWIYSDAKE